MRDDAFACVCKLASTKHWCWKIHCSTCQHIHFRSALWELSLGRHPEDDDWITGGPRPEADRFDAERIPRLSRFPRREESRGPGETVNDVPRYFPDANAEALANVLAEANLKTIATECTFPDWLGYLGLALHYAGGQADRARILTTAWLPQLAQMLPEDSPLRLNLSNDSDSPNRTLRWTGLETFERALAGGPYAKGGGDLKRRTD